MSEDPRTPDERGQSGVRFEVTVHTGTERPGPEEIARISALDLDRVPDRNEVRLLVTMEDAARLVDQGFEVRLLRAVPVRPLDPELIAGDEAVQEWFAQRVGDVSGQGPGDGPDDSPGGPDAPGHSGGGEG